jgi:hypothetical protein
VAADLGRPRRFGTGCVGLSAAGSGTVAISPEDLPRPRPICFAIALRAKFFGPGHPLDASKYFIVIPDAIGHVKSSKPQD